MGGAASASRGALSVCDGLSMSIELTGSSSAKAIALHCIVSGPIDRAPCSSPVPIHPVHVMFSCSPGPKAQTARTSSRGLPQPQGDCSKLQSAQLQWQALNKHCYNTSTPPSPGRPSIGCTTHPCARPFECLCHVPLQIRIQIQIPIPIAHPPTHSLPYSSPSSHLLPFLPPQRLGL